MGRETKILLALLGGLSFVFLGALLAKLLVARPPEGAGVDVHANLAAAGPNALVEPPAPGRPQVSAFAAADASGVQPAAFDQPAAVAEPVPPQAAEIEDAVLPVSLETPADGPAGRPEPDTRPEPAAAQEIHPEPRPRPVVAGSSRTLEPGDTWWGLAEAAYGDGRHHRALYAWNRAIDPTVAAAPGRRIEVPPLERLSAAYPGLVPAAAAAPPQPR